MQEEPIIRTTSLSPTAPSTPTTLAALLKNQDERLEQGRALFTDRNKSVERSQETIALTRAKQKTF